MQIKLLCERQLNAKWTKNSWKLFITRTKIKNTPRASAEALTLFLSAYSTVRNFIGRRQKRGRSPHSPLYFCLIILEFRIPFGCQFF